jgi:methyl-accepting chemotaxis protein
MKITSIRVKLLLILLPFFILSFAILSGISYYLSSQSLAKSVDETARALGTDYANQTQADIQEKMARLEEIAMLPQFQNGNDKIQIVEAMAAAKNRLGVFDNFVFIFPNGDGVRVNGGSAQYNNDKNFQKVFATKKATVSYPQVSKVTGKMIVVLTVPVLHNGQLMGMIAAVYSLDKLSETVQGLKFKETGFGFLADYSGLVIAHPEHELIGKLNLSEKKINPELKMQQTELDDRLIDLFKTVVEKNQQIEGIYRTGDGVSRFAVSTPINLPGDVRWVMIVTAPEVEVNKATSTLARTMVIVSLLFIIIAVLFIVVLSRRFTKSIQLLRDECILLMQGDFRERQAQVFSQDEIGQLAEGFRKMRSTLGALVIKVQSQADQVAAASEELTAGAHQSADAANQVAGSITEIARGTEKQAVSATQISAVVEQMTGSTELISVTVRELSEIAKNTSVEADQGRQAVEQAVDQMKQISEGSAAVQTAITELAQGSREIREIVDLISSIAGQTNLLALNAAIEAARAGEQGRGFAVVAEEVRKLAEESNQAAQQIGALIQKNHTNMNQAVAATQAGAEGVQAGMVAVNSAGEMFKKIVGSIIQLSEQIREISESINQMAMGSRTLLSSIHEIDIVSKENASETQSVSAATEEQSASMQEIASSSQSLAKLANDLQEAIAKFRV